MYVRYATGNYDPNGSGWTNSAYGTDDYFYPGVGSTLLNIIGSPSARTCPTTPLCRTCRGFTQESIFVASNEPLLENLAKGKVMYKANTTESHYINKVIAYRQLSNQHKGKSGSSTNIGLNQFYASTAKSNIGNLFSIEEELLAQNFTSAKAKIAIFAPDNTIETNYINYYNAYINNKQGTLSYTDSLNLITLANGCPFTDGGVVYQARALYNIVFDTYRLFYDICYAGTNQRESENIDAKNISTISFSKIYPNPTNEIINVEVNSAKEKKDVTIEVYDIAGKLVYNSKSNLNNNLVTFQTDLNNGTYLVKIKLGDGTIDIHRLVISK